MKKVILVLLFAFGSFISAQDNHFKYISDCNYFEHSNSNSITNTNYDLLTWNFFQTSTTYLITDVQFLGSFGWATHIDMGLVLTSNAGTNWTAISFNDTNFTTLFNGVYFINAQTGWAVGGALLIRKTTNGGLNWIRQTPPPIAGVLNSIYFFNANTGYAIGRKGMYYNSCALKTTDGGSNWSEVVLSTSNENELFDQYWFNSQTGWICGRNFLKKTTDGGTNFNDYFSNVPPTSNGANALLCINFLSDQTGWIGGSNLDGKNIYKTTNGGMNWVFQNNPVAQYTYPQINDIKMINGGMGWAAHGTPSSGAILYTSNGGVNWVIDNGTNARFDCLWIYNDYQIYCGASEGKIWYSTIPTGIKQNGNNIPNKYSLYQNYPNPFNPSTNIKFDVAKTSNVSLKVYDITGKEVAVLVNEKLSAGSYNLSFDASRLSSGTYIYKMDTYGYSEVKKMLLIK
jgi:photosystem II stability/assembly factor-like uncharacterized protein